MEKLQLMDKFDFRDLGLSSLNVSDFHNGEHSKHGCIISMNRKIQNRSHAFFKHQRFYFKKMFDQKINPKLKR